MFIISIDNKCIVSVLNDISELDFDYKVLMEESKSEFVFAKEYRSSDGKVILYLPLSTEAISSDNFVSYICGEREYKIIEKDINIAVATGLLKIYQPSTIMKDESGDITKYSMVYPFMGYIAYIDVSMMVPIVEKNPLNTYGYVKGHATTHMPLINIILIIMKNPSDFNGKLMLSDSINSRTTHNEGIYYHNTSVEEHKSEILEITSLHDSMSS